MNFIVIPICKRSSYIHKHFILYTIVLIPRWVLESLDTVVSQIGVIGLNIELDPFGDQTITHDYKIYMRYAMLINSIIDYVRMILNIKSSVDL